MTYSRRQAEALESIALSLLKLANPLVTVEAPAIGGAVLSPEEVAHIRDVLRGIQR
jgi:hypothetical protein